MPAPLLGVDVHTHPHTHKNNLKISVKKFEGLVVCAGAKNGEHITIFVQCAYGCGPKSPLTKGLDGGIKNSE